MGVRDQRPKEIRKDPSEQIEAFYRRFPQLRGRRYLLFLARIHAKKGCDLLLEAFGRIAASVPDVDLVMAGPDQEGMQTDLQRMVLEQAGVVGKNPLARQYRREPEMGRTPRLPRVCIIVSLGKLWDCGC